jgi:hypothetical protein
VLIEAPLSKSYDFTQLLQGGADEVFVLLCPVREAEWVPGWRPHLVIAESGLAERDCVFVTPDGESREATWVITEHDPIARSVEMLKISPGFLVTRLRIDVAPAAEGRSTARVQYRYTAIGPMGRSFVSDQTSERWVEFMRGWERAMNDFLLGRRASGGAPAGTSTSCST